ncbi:MAG TPA: right-handed parallel beta-helix repeat-containing protein [Ardenticatenaceae bacterium]
MFALLILPHFYHTPIATAAGPWYVAPSGADANECRAPESPCATVNGALDKPGFAPGDTILVASGTYTSTAPTKPVICLDKDAALSGGWNAAFSAQSGESIISGAGENLFGVIVMPNVVASMDRFTLGGFSGLLANRAAPAWVSLASTSMVASDGAFRGYPQGGDQNLCQTGVTTAIYNHGTFTLTNSLVAGVSFGWGLFNDGRFTLLDSQVGGNHYAGIANYSGATMAVYRTRISGNFGVCAGISNHGNLIVVSSTVSHNDTWFNAYGGGLCNRGQAVLVNTVVSHNLTQGSPEPGNEESGSGGGIYNISGTLSLYSSTISRNGATRGGGIFNESAGTVTLSNTLVASNYSRTINRTPDCGGTLRSHGYNLLSQVEGCDWVPGAGDLLGVGAGVFPGLMGWPGYPPLPRTSPAVNAGNPEGCRGPEGELLLVDQRGVARDGRCDIGAYEYSPEHDPLFYAFAPWIQRE